MANLSNLKINLEYLRFLLKRNTRLMILVSVLMFALYPLLSFTQFVLTQNYSRTTFLVGQVLLLVLFVLSIFLIPFVLFNYLNSKRNLDVYHALPITRKNLYLTTIVAGLVIIFIPFTLNYVGGSLYYLAVIPDVDGWLLVKQYWFALAFVLPILMPILFSMMNTGTNLDGFLYGVILHLIAPISYGAYVVYGQSVLLGFRLADFSKFLLYSSPIWSLFELTFNTERINPNPLLMSFYWLAIGFVLTFVVLYFYQIRKSEKAESPFTNNWFFPVIATIFIIIIQVFLFSSFTAFINDQSLDLRTLLFPVFFTFVAYMVLDVIANRGFKHFLKGLTHFGIITAVTLSGFVIATSTGGAGYVNKVPDIASVESVSLTLYDNSGSGLFGSSPYSYEKYLYQVSEKMEFSDEKYIEAIIKTHQTILEQHKVYNIPKNQYRYTTFEHDYPFVSSNNSEVTMEIIYHLNNGSKMARYYQLPFVWTYDLLPIIETDQVFIQKFPALSSNVFNQFTPSKVTYTNALVQDPIILDNFQIETFARFLKADYTQKDWQQHMEGSSIFGFVAITLCNEEVEEYKKECHFQQYPVLTNYARTIAYLNSLQVDGSYNPEDSRVYSLLLPDNNVRLSPIFYLSSISGSMHVNHSIDTSKKVQVLHLDTEQFITLFPYLRMGNINEVAVGAVFVYPPDGFLSESFIPNVVYTLSKEAIPIVEQLKLELPIQMVDFYDLSQTIYRSK